MPFLVVVASCSQRYWDRNAWLLSRMFGAFIAGVDLPNFISVVHPILRKPLLATGTARRGTTGRAVWLLHALSGANRPGSADAVAEGGLARAAPGCGDSPRGCYARDSGTPLHLSTELHPGLERAFGYTMGAYSLAGYGLGLVSLILNSFVAGPETRNAARHAGGTAGALVPLIIVGTYAEAHDLEFIELPFWVWVGAIMAVLLLPLSFAYAVAKHRVMEIPVLLRRSARYLVVHHAIIVFGTVIGVTLTIVLPGRCRDPALTTRGHGWAERLSGVAGACSA